MTNENIQEIIIEHFTDGVEIPTEIKTRINDSDELTTYYQEMKDILSYKDSSEDEPSDDYWDSYYSTLEEKLPVKKTKFLSITRSNYFRNAIAACLLVAIGFYGGQIFSSEEIKQQNIRTVEVQTKLKSLLHKSTVVLTSFTTMSEYEAFDVLPVNAKISQSLLDDTKEMRKSYSEDRSIDELLSELERILTVISSTKDNTPAQIKMAQFGVERRNMIQKIRQVQI